MTTETMKAKIKELNTMVKSLSDDSKSKTELIETQSSLIRSLRTENRDLQDALFIKDGELVECENSLTEKESYYQDRENKAKARISIINQVASDALSDRDF